MAKAKKTTAKKEAPTATQNGGAQASEKATATPNADLSIGDLKNLATIIDVASTRGAFRANEMATVGVMFNKLQAFLAKVAPEQKTEDAKAAAPATAQAK